MGNHTDTRPTGPGLLVLLCLALLGCSDSTMATEDSGSGPDAPCADGSICIDDGDADLELGVCAVSCVSSGVCRPGYDCLEASAGSTDMACQPACTTDDECAAARTCQASGLCE